MTQPEAKLWTIGDVLRWAADDFRARGVESPRLDAEILLAHALATTRIALVVDAKRPLEPSELGRFRELVKRRRQREPVAYLLGAREFFGRPFRVDARVLVPRPETEGLVEASLARTAWCSLSTRALDLCTGSGCVAVSIARERPTACVWATDLSDGALAVARANALRLGAYNVAFAKGDLFGALPAGARFDVIAANPPYVASAEVATLMPDVRDFEPRLALDGGPDGLAVLRRIVDEAPRWLAPRGALCLEVGAGEADAVADALRAAGFVDVVKARDYARIERVVHGVLPEAARA